ncbi:hypothetical protein GA0111570_109122 [Raineyella antarctica]|uniref:Phosphoribosylanthranilate isomerase n=1 Tax=Raineyella antarctica TaxID=1577474 RepID=A0A1G6HGH1_9ACTN|nr:hypothetical protein [Raineyella antarctica]SDB93218.1 hypothetical protein GA0111570_109122 [Raineyella antarctica]
MTWITTSGVTVPEDIALCAGLGVDAVGLVVDFPGKVPWGVRLDEAEVLLAGLPAGVERVVVVGDDPDLVLRITRRLAPDIVHLHAVPLPAPTRQTGSPAPSSAASSLHMDRLVRMLHDHDVRVMGTLRLRAADGTVATPT